MLLKVYFIKSSHDQYQPYPLDPDKRYFQNIKFARLRNAPISHTFSLV